MRMPFYKSTSAIVLLAILLQPFWKTDTLASDMPEPIMERGCSDVVIGSQQVNTIAETTAEIQKILQSKTGCQLNDNISYVQNTIQQGTTPLWAQEYIGADLAKEVLARYPKAKTVRFGHTERVHLASMKEENLDEFLRKCKKNPKQSDCPDQTLNSASESASKVIRENFQHGTAMSNLVSHPIVGVAAKAELGSFSFDADETGEGGKNLYKNLDEIRKKNIQLFCSSVVFNNHSEINKAMDEMYASNIILIRGAGNSFPDYKDSNQGNTKKSILVGSLSPYGIPSFYSNDAPEGTFQVFAPSDNSIYSSYENSPYKFGGTSGAQPLVCGAAANVLSLLPGINTEELMELMKRSSIQLPTFNLQKHNTQGMINAYKLAKMAERLAAEWPQNRKEIYSDKDLKNFKSEVAPLISEAKKYQPFTNVCQRRSALALLRRAFLLEPNAETADIISQIYRNAGLNRMATFYANFRGPDLKALEAMYRDGGNDRVLAAGAIRAAYELYGKDALPLLREALQNGSYTDITKTAMVGMAKTLPENAAKLEAMQAFQKQANPIGMRGIMFAAKNELRFSLTEFLPLIQSAKISPDAKEMLENAVKDDQTKALAQDVDAVSSDRKPAEDNRKGK